MLSAAAGPGAGAAQPATADDYAGINRELESAARDFEAALTDQLGPRRRVVDAAAGYLAGQGVLLSVDLADTWFRAGSGDTPIGDELTHLDRIPDMVHDILTELDLGLSRHQVQDLDALREVRDAQKVERAAQRALRRKLREARLALQRGSGSEGEEAVRDRIDDLRAELEASEKREQTLSREAAERRTSLDAPRPPDAPPMEPGALDRAVSEALCRTAFGAVPDGQHVNVVVRQADQVRYSVFTLADVRRCRRGDASPGDLLELGVRYGP